MQVDHLLATWGYGAVAVLVGAESIGVPLPGETALIAAAAYAGQTHHLTLWGVLATAALGAIAGDNIGYLIGAHGGYRLARRFGKRVGLDESRLKVARYVFDRYGAKVVFLGRFVSILRMYSAFLAGTSRMAWRRFLPANAAGGVLWAGVYSVAAYFAGDALRRLSSTLNIAFVGLAVAGAIGVLLVMRHATTRLAGAAEAAYPGPLA